MKDFRHSRCRHLLWPFSIFIFISFILLLNLIENAFGMMEPETNLNDLLAGDGENENSQKYYEAFQHGQNTNDRTHLKVNQVFLSIVLHARDLGFEMKRKNKKSVNRLASQRSSLPTSQSIQRTQSIAYNPKIERRLTSGTSGVIGKDDEFSSPPGVNDDKDEEEEYGLPGESEDKSGGSDDEYGPPGEDDDEPASGGNHPQMPPRPPQSMGHSAGGYGLPPKAPGRKGRKKRGANEPEVENTEHNEILENEARKMADELAQQSRPMIYYQIDFDYDKMAQNASPNSLNTLDKHLIIKIIKATNIPPMDTGGLSDPFVEVTVADYKDAAERKAMQKKFGEKLKGKTKTKQKTLEPLPHGRNLIFRIFDANMFSKKEKIGEFVVTFDYDDADELLVVDDPNNEGASASTSTNKIKKKHMLPFKQWRKIPLEPQADLNLVHSPMIKLMHQSKILEALISMDSESRYKAMLDYCNNRWNILQTEKGRSPFSEEYIEDVMEMIKKGALPNVLEAEAEQLRDYHKFWKSDSEDEKYVPTLLTHWRLYNGCLDKVFKDRAEARTFAHLGMSEKLVDLMRDLMVPQPIYLAKEVNKAMEGANLDILMEFASTLDMDDLAMTKRLVQLLFNDNMDFRENVKFMGKLTASLTSVTRQGKVLNFLYWRYHGQEERKKDIEEAYGQTESRVDALVQTRLNDMQENTKPSVVYSMYKEVHEMTKKIKITFQLNRMVKLPAMDANLLSDPFVDVILQKPYYSKEMEKQIKKEEKAREELEKKAKKEEKARIEREEKARKAEEKARKAEEKAAAATQSSKSSGFKLLSFSKKTNAEEEQSKLTPSASSLGGDEEQPLLKSSSSNRWEGSSHSFKRNNFQQQNSKRMSGVVELEGLEESAEAQKAKEKYVDVLMSDEMNLDLSEKEPLVYKKDILATTELQNDTLNPIYNIYHPFKVVFEILPQRLAHARLLLSITDRDGPTNRDDKITDVQLDLNDPDNYGTNVVKDIRPMLIYKIIRNTVEQRNQYTGIKEKKYLAENLIVLRAINLPSTDKNGLSDPNVKLIVEGNSRAETGVVKRDLNPVFNRAMPYVDAVKLLQRPMHFDIEDFDDGLIWKSYDPIGQVPLVLALNYPNGMTNPLTGREYQTDAWNRPYYEWEGHRFLVAFDPKNQNQPFPFDMVAKRQVAIDNYKHQFIVIVDEFTGKPFPFDETTGRQMIALENSKPMQIEVREMENGQVEILGVHNQGDPIELATRIQRMNPTFRDLLIDNKKFVWSPKYAAENYNTRHLLYHKKQKVQFAISSSEKRYLELITNCPKTGHAVDEIVTPIVVTSKKARDHQLELERMLADTSKRPQLHYKLSYDKQSGMLSVKLREGQNLPNKDKTGKSDPFVVLYLLPSMEKIGKTEVCHEKLNPVFNWEFQLKIPKDKLKTSTLVFDIIDYDFTSANDKMGIATVPLKWHRDVCPDEGYYPKMLDKIAGYDVVWVELDKLGLVEWGKLLMRPHFTLIGPIEFRTYWYMVQDEMLQRRYFEQLLIKSFRTRTSLVEGLQQTVRLEYWISEAKASANIHRILVGRYDYDLAQIVTPQAKRFAHWVDQIKGLSGIGANMADLSSKIFNWDRVPVSRPYRAALRKLMGIENRNLVHYDEFLDNYGLFVSKHIDNILDPNGFTFKMLAGPNNRQLTIDVSSPWSKISPSDYLHQLVADLNQSVVNQMDLMFRRDFRLLANNKLTAHDLVTNEFVERFESIYNKLTPDVQTNPQNGLIYQYLKVMTALVIAHNKALAIVLQCIGKPYKVIRAKQPQMDDDDKNKQDGDKSKGQQKQKKTGIMEKTKMNPVQKTLREQQEYEAQTLDVESVENQALDPDEEERYYQDLEMAQFRIKPHEVEQDQFDEREAFGTGATDRIGNTGLQCPPFSIDVPETSWPEKELKRTYYENREEFVVKNWNNQMREELGGKVKNIAESMIRGLVNDILTKKHSFYISTANNKEKKYTYRIGRAILRKLGYLNESSYAQGEYDSVHTKLAKEIAQKMIDNIGAMMEKKHNQLMSDSDENFVFEQVDFTPMQLSLTGNSPEAKETSKFERFMQKCFNWLNVRIQSLHSKSVKKKNRMARFLFRWIHTFMSSIRDVITGKEKKLSFILRTFFPVLYYGRKIMVKLGKTLKRMAGRLRVYLFTANGRREFKQDIYGLMQKGREVFNKDKWNKMQKYMEEKGAHNLSGNGEDERQEMEHFREINYHKELTRELLRDEEAAHKEQQTSVTNEEDLLASLGSIGNSMAGKGGARGGNQNQEQSDYMENYNSEMPPNSIDRFYTWEMELDNSVAEARARENYANLYPRRKREIDSAAQNQTALYFDDANIQNAFLDESPQSQPKNNSNSNNFDDNFQANSPSSSQYYGQQSTGQFLRRIKRKGGFGRAAAGRATKSAVASKHTVLYGHVYSSPSPFMPSYNPNRTSYTYVYISDNHYHDGGHCLMTSHKWMLLGVWTLGHGVFFLMVTLPVHSDMKRVDCDTQHGFREFCKSFVYHLFFKYIKGIYVLGKAIFQRIRGQFKWKKEMNAREFGYSQGTTGSAATGRVHAAAEVAKPISFGTHLMGEEEYYRRAWNDCGRIYSGLFIAFQLLIWLVGLIVIIAAF